VHFLQIWIRPDRSGVQPGYEQKHFDASEKRGRLRLVVSGDGAEGSVTVHQDARMYAGLFDGAESAQLDVKAGRRLYVHLVRGELTVQGTRLRTGDALKLTEVTRLEIRDGSDAEVLVFDLPG
jgi:redox-sensitive bicupin YhaK (pirin superfamily)